MVQARLCRQGPLLHASAKSEEDEEKPPKGEEMKPAVKTAVSSEATGESRVDGGAGELLTEVTSLLKSLRLQPPQLRAYQLKKIDGVGSKATLLDGGATHCLRKTENEKEWEESLPVKVQLASGEASMRMHPKKKTLLVNQEVQNIIPVSKMTELGYEVKWMKSGCQVHGPQGERLDVDMEQGCPVVSEAIGRTLMKQIEDLEAGRAALRAVIVGNQEPANDLEKLAQEARRMFPNVPTHLLERIPCSTMWKGEELPFNRRRRRQIAQAKTVILHLFSGVEDPKWKRQEGNGVVVITLDILHGGDLLHNESLVGWIQEMAMTGRVDLWLAGPPCRSVSALRCKEDGGPVQLRGREEGRFGLPGLGPRLQQMVDGDSLLWLRMLFWMHLSARSGAQSEYLVEQPLDPQEWWNKEIPASGLPSFMVWEESRRVFEELKLDIVRIEQGALGLATPKPTMLATNVSEIKAIDGLRSDSYDPTAWNLPLEERIEKSKKLATWAPGLKSILFEVIKRVHNKTPPKLRVLTMKERQEVQAWQDHHRAGHLPFRKDCPTCLLGAGKDRYHKRLGCPTSYTLSMDIMGPFCSGTDQAVNGCRYALVGVYTVPIDGKGDPLPEGLQMLKTAQKTEEDLEEEEAQVEGSDQVQPWEQEDASEEDGQDDSPAVVRQQQVLEAKWKEFIKDRRSQPVVNVTFGVPLRSREAGDVIAATATIFAKVRAMRLPVTRVHTDRAREFAGSKFQQWTRDRDIFHTMCAGSEPQANSRAERELGALKAQMRTLLLGSAAPIHYWPLAFRQSVEMRQRSQLRKLGILLPQLLPFGARAVVRRKEWHHRADPFRWPMMKVRLWGPAGDMAASTQGYYVEDENGKFLRSTVVMIPSSVAEPQGPVGEPQSNGVEGEALGSGEVVSLETGEIEEQGQVQPEKEEKGPAVPDILSGGEEEDGEGQRPFLGVQELQSMECGAVLEEVKDNKNLRPLAPHDAPKRRYMMKAPPIASMGFPMVYKLEAEHQEETGAPNSWNGGSGPTALEREAFERIGVNQHWLLGQWIGEASRLIEDGRGGEEEVRLINSVQEERKALEQLLSMSRVCKLQGGGDGSGDQEVLQTKTVPMDEVRRNVQSWTPAFAEEVKSLTERALKPIGEEEFRALVEGPDEVECLPMKGVATIKAGGRMKGRVVVCGNYASEKHDEGLDNSASGVDSVCIRTMANLAVHRGWTASTIDVKGAFLLAPRRSASKRITIGEPPSILKTMGLVAPGERWLIRHALYGLQESPGDWGVHRDQTLRTLTWKVHGEECHLVPTAEKHVWRAQKTGNNPEESGFLLTYVDDLLVLGVEDHVRALTTKLSETWQCSPPDFLAEGSSMRFCGFEFVQQGENWKLCQTGYTKDLLARYNITSGETVPLPKLPDEDEAEDYTPQDLRCAQSIVGELLWLGARTRPDVCFAIGTLGRMVHKRPKLVKELGLHVLRYLWSSSERGLVYQPCKPGDLGHIVSICKFPEVSIVWRCTPTSVTLRQGRVTDQFSAWWWNMVEMWFAGNPPGSHSSAIQRQNQN